MINERMNPIFEVQKYEFVLLETNLYLDSHPDDQEALEYFRRMLALYKDAKEKYEAKCGPITPDSTGIGYERWEWVMTPWPWELEAN